MELLVLVAIVALLIVGPRRGGRMPGALAIVAGVIFLAWLAAAFGLGWVWRAAFGEMLQP